MTDRKRKRTDFERMLDERIEETNKDLRVAYEEVQKKNVQLEAELRQCKEDKLVLYQHMEEAQKRMNEAEERAVTTNEFWNKRQQQLEVLLLNAWALAKIPLDVTPMPREQGNGTA